MESLKCKQQKSAVAALDLSEGRLVWKLKAKATEVLMMTFA